MGRKPVGERPMTPAERQQRRRNAPAHIVIHMGSAWRLSASKYAKLVAAIRNDQEYDLDTFGAFLGDVSSPRDDAAA